MKPIRRFWLFLSTLTTSALNERSITGRLRWSKARQIATALRTGLDTRVGGSWWKRTRGCQRCSLFDRKRRSCGRTGETYQRGGIMLPLGCGCFIPLKAKVPDAQCWLFEETGGEAGVDWRF